MESSTDNAPINRKAKCEKNGVPKVIKDNREKPAFDFDCLTQIAHVIPGVPRFSDPWEEIFARLDGAPGENGETEIWSQAAGALRQVLTWSVQPYQGKPFTKKTADKALIAIGRRALALAWTINPALFDGQSLRAVTRNLCLCRPALADLTGEVSRTFKIRNRSQAHYKPRKPKNTGDLHANGSRPSDEPTMENHSATDVSPLVDVAHKT